jgi:alginate O-acetyltransferase complex protein AlgJ
MIVALFVGAARAQDPARDFQKFCAAKAAQCEKSDAPVVAGRDGWLFFGESLRHVGLEKFWGEEAARVCRAQKAEWADPAPAIVKFHNELKRLGIELLLAPVPPKVLTYPDKLDARFSPGKRLDPGLAAFYQTLEKEGVTVFDLLPQFMAARGEDEKEGPVYCRTDAHYTPRGARIVARLIAGELKKRPWAKHVPRQDFALDEEPLEITGDLLGMLGEAGKPIGKEKVRLFRVGRKAGAKLAPITPDKDSPVLLLGDSHTLVFHDGDDLHATQGGLPDLLALELGFPVDLLGIRGSAATTARVDLYRTAVGDPAWLTKKKAVIYCFTSRELTESASGWRPLPVVK